ncbi:hypothetical protein TNCV_52801 [Trichonephila clavipes]|nr:hypothetical protein TNCV_52801 [Trichonephila clavipes]
MITKLAWGQRSSLQTDPLIETSTHAPQRPMVTYTEMGTSSGGRSSLVVKISDRGWHVTSLRPVLLKTCHVGERCTFNLSKAQTSSRWCGVVVKGRDVSSGVILVT